MRFFKILILIFYTTVLYAQPLYMSNHVKLTNILPYSKIYIDKSQTLTINNILKNDIPFKKNKQNILSFGFSPNFDVWIQFSLTNNSKKTIHKIVEYKNPLTTHIEFYDPDKNFVVQKDGLFTINTKRRTLNPIFHILIKPHETKTYYLKASSYITTLIININMWDSTSFYQTEVKHQFILALFFGAMMILGFYNLFIFFFTKDISYLFYFLYVVGVVIHHGLYVGVVHIYILNQTWIIHIVNNAAFAAALPIFWLVLFTKTFLRTKQYPILDKLLTLLIILLPFTTLVFTLTNEFNKYRNIMPVLVLSYLIFITIYAVFKKNRQAYFILIGWSAIFIAILFMLLSSVGMFSIYQYIPYYIEVSLVFEAVIFSIALADRIKQLQADKEKANQKLFDQQVNERRRLFMQVEEKTRDLKIALDEKQLLLKELNHRVKNNMQTIVSLIRLQKDKIKDEKLKDVLTTIQNRIKSISHLHELLYENETIAYVNAYEYFELIIEGIEESYENEVNIHIDIQTKLKNEQAIYCGLILNELITNSLKYAFPNQKGNIYISLKKNKNTYDLSISDDGIGYNQSMPTNSLGNILVDTLVKRQIKGNITVDSKDGVKVRITWEDNE
ncbi:7TM diverse intracellular signaling domain-containing protein [Sulfurospirillum arcachonense]|uniref:7TM diverse intracellular signaling domain-containing protein n=1 Tax=Sulfurospirillum arcachonense TaxID=57666 RepID=UPI000468607B|nr:7TM diverse intracellular signaling domain-containing protein [Sulfurospirillum arcachonense]